jgi:cytochrome c biogenesis protein CcmG/thiol:disulfide interchange protein DsbE
MRLIFVFVSTLLVLAGPASADEPGLAPDFTLESISGDSITLSEVTAEQPVILLFWATWCPYCKALMPHIQSIRLEQGDEVRVLAVHFRDDKGDPAAFIRNAGYDFTVLRDGNDVAKLYNVWGTPGLLLIDRDRAIRFNLYELPRPDFPKDESDLSHPQKAAYRAPYWAAEIRKSLDVILSD